MCLSHGVRYALVAEEAGGTTMDDQASFPAPVTAAPADFDRDQFSHVKILGAGL